MRSEAAPSDQLRAKRQVAILAVERLLRVCTAHEPESWLRHYRQVLEALCRDHDEEAILIEKRVYFDHFSHADHEFLRWVVSERLAEQVHKTVARLRTHLTYDDQRPPVTIDEEDPKIDAAGSRDRCFAWIKQFLIERVEVACAQGQTEVDKGAVATPFLKHPEAVRLKAELKAGDELWKFSTPAESWKNLGGRAGFALVRDGEIIEDFVNLRN